MFRSLLELARRSLESICIALFAATVVLAVVQVLFRYVIGYSIPWSEELARMCFVWATYLGIAVVAGQGRHMRMELFTDRVDVPSRCA